MKNNKINSKSEEEWSHYFQQHQLHIDRINEIKVQYNQRIYQAQHNSERYGSWILDHTSAIFCPTVYPVPKKTQLLDRIKLHLCGFIDHAK